MVLHLYHIKNMYTCQKATKRIHILPKLKYFESRVHLSKVYKKYILTLITPYIKKIVCFAWSITGVFKAISRLSSMQGEFATIVVLPGYLPFLPFAAGYLHF